MLENLYGMFITPIITTERVINKLSEDILVIFNFKLFKEPLVSFESTFRYNESIIALSLQQQFCLYYLTVC